MTRPWVTPQQVRDYTDIKSVKERTDDKLKVDISRAEEYVIAYTHNSFSDTRYATVMPESVLTAIILLAEAYASNAATAAKMTAQTYKSETFDDYNYTAADGSVITTNSLDLSSLLDNYILSTANGNINMRLRRL